MMVRSLQQLNTPRNEKAHLDQAKFPSPCSSSFTIAADAEVVLGKAETRFSVHFLSRFFTCGTLIIIIIIIIHRYHKGLRRQ